MKEEESSSSATKTPVTGEGVAPEETGRHVTVDGTEKEETKGGAKEEVRGACVEIVGKIEYLVLKNS